MVKEDLIIDAEAKYVDVSILMPSLQDCQEQVRRIREIPTSFTYEILTCGNEINKNIPGIRYFDDPGTSVKAINMLYKNSLGRYIIGTSGSILVPRNLFSIIDRLKLMEEKDDTFAISSLCGPEKMSHRVTQEVVELARAHNVVKERPHIIRWPAFSRKTCEIHMNGVVFNEHFRHHYVDSWLGLYFYLIGKEVNEEVDINIENVPHVSITKNDAYDLEIIKKLASCYHMTKKYNFDPEESSLQGL